jgi:Leucine-rich repeat (LRR) protein
MESITAVQQPPPIDVDIASAAPPGTTTTTPEEPDDSSSRSPVVTHSATKRSRFSSLKCWCGNGSSILQVYSTLLVVMVLLFVGILTFYMLYRKQLFHPSDEAAAAVSNRNADYYVAFRDTLLNEIGPRDPTLQRQLWTPSSHEYRALQWIMLYDRYDSSNDSKNNHPAMPSVQRFAIASVFLSWGLTLNPDTHECTWTGITCESDGKSNKSNSSNDDVPPSITKFQMINTPLWIGTIPASLGYLTHLHTIHLPRQQLQGSIPKQFELLTNLQSVDLSENQLTTIFDHGIIWRNATHLISLNVANNILQEPLVLSLPKSNRFFKYLNVQGNRQLGGNLSSIYPRSFLQTLDVTRTEITGTIPSDIWTSLRTFTATFTFLSGTLPSQDTPPPALEILSLSSTRIQGTLPDWQQAKLDHPLQQISLSNSNLTGTLPIFWGGGNRFPNLQLLDLFGNDLSGTIPTTWGNFTNLQILRLASNPKIAGSIPSELGHLQNLQDLELYQTNLRGSMPTEVCALRKQGQLKELTANCRSGRNGGDLDPPPVACPLEDCCSKCYVPL